MKRILMLMFMASVAIGLWAQKDSFLPLFDDGKVWEERCQSYVQTDSVCGDVEFQGRICKLLRYRNSSGFEYDYIVYEEGGRSFYFNTYFNQFYPLMDFNLKEGDVTEIKTDGSYYTEYSTINKVEAIYIRGKERLKISSDCFNWIEGIGGDGMLTYFVFVARGFSSRSDYYFECRKDGEILCSSDDTDLRFFIGFNYSGVENIIAEKDDDGPIYDTMGRRVETPQPGRLYIRNGHKFIAKP